METEKQKIDLKEDDWYVFIPDEEWFALDRTLFKLEQASNEFSKLKDEMVIIES